MKVVSLALLLLSSITFQAQAYTSFYVFGDALSSTTDNPQTGSLYYGKRYANGRVWVEVLAQRQGLIYDSSKNNSYYDHNSSHLVTDVKNFVPPPDVATALFVIWVCNSDTFDAASAGDNSSQWINANKQSQVNHFQIITNLYAKGVRTLIMPNAVDISTIPAFNAGSLASSEHAGCVDYYARFTNTIAQARAACPGLTIYAPDFYSLLNATFTNAAYYGLTNFLVNGHPMDAADAFNYGYPHAQTNGYGTNFIFWDYMDPTAKFHAIIADIAQQIISPVKISGITAFVGSNRLDIANVPVGLNGFVDNCTNIWPANWVAIQNFVSTNTAQSIFVLTTNSQGGQHFAPKDISPGPGGTPILTDLQFYRMRFPYAWVWP